MVVIYDLNLDVVVDFLLNRKGNHKGAEVPQRVFQTKQIALYCGLYPYNYVFIQICPILIFEKITKKLF